MKLIDNLRQRVTEFNELLQSGRLIQSIILENEYVITDMNSEDQLYEQGINRLGVNMTAWYLPTFCKGVDAVSSATVLGGYEASTYDMFMGFIPGTIGEVSKIAILIGFAYLLIRKVISWRIPVVFVGTFAVLAAIFRMDQDVLTSVLSGGLLFGAVFMATDYTTSPMTEVGQYIYAFGCGLILAVIRKWGSYTEGVTYAILIMNVATPLIDKFVKIRVYGQEKPKKEVKANV